MIATPPRVYLRKVIRQVDQKALPHPHHSSEGKELLPCYATQLLRLAGLSSPLISEPIQGQNDPFDLLNQVYSLSHFPMPTHQKPLDKMKERARRQLPMASV